MSVVLDADLVVDARARLGEGPCWDEVTGRLLWVDIPGRSVHVTDPATGADDVIEVDQEISIVVPLAHDHSRWVVGVRDGLGHLDGDGTLTITHPVNRAGVRMNDGKCDPAGRLFAGSMAFDASDGAGMLRRLDPDGTLTDLVDGLTIANGMAWSAEGDTMYFIDSLDCHVDAFAYDPASGAIDDRRHAFPIGMVGGADGLRVPDGMTRDAEGCLWVAVHGAGEVRRVDVDGTLRATVRVPAPHVTSCCFGGDDLTTLFVTTARQPLDDEGRAAHPHAGGLFAVDAGVVGTPSYAFAGDPRKWVGP